jgi:hypothetical protein
VDVGLLARLEDAEVGLDGAEVGDDPVGSRFGTVGRTVPAGPALALRRCVGCAVDGEVLDLGVESPSVSQARVEYFVLVLVKSIE